MNHGWQSEATDGPRAAKRKESAKRKKSADRSGKYFSTPETWTVECNCRRIFANIWFSQVWKHSSYIYAIPWCFKIWAWLRHEFLETAIPWWFTSKFWPRHELGMSLSFDCTQLFYLYSVKYDGWFIRGTLQIPPKKINTWFKKVLRLWETTSFSWLHGGSRYMFIVVALYCTHVISHPYPMSAKPAWNVRDKQRCARRCGTSEIGTSALGSGSHGLAGGDHQKLYGPGWTSKNSPWVNG